VDEHAEAGFVPPLHAGFAVGLAAGPRGAPMAVVVEAEAAAPAAIICK